MMRTFKILILTIIMTSSFSLSLPAANSVKDKMTKKLQIIIPKVRFKDRDLDFAVQFIKKRSRELDEAGHGINIVVIKGKPQAKKKLINIDADDISIAALIRYMCDQLDLSYKVEGHAVIIGNAKVAKMSTKFYLASANFVGLVPKGENGKQDFKAFFESLGIQFHHGAKIKYIKNVLRLVITNTPAEHEKLKKLLKQL